MSQVVSSPVNNSRDVMMAAGGGQSRLVRELTIINKRGLHARASAKFVQTVERFDARVCVCRNGEEVCGTSIMGLMMLAASTGTSVIVSVEGPEADASLTALSDLVANRFGEEE